MLYSNMENIMVCGKNLIYKNYIYIKPVMTLFSNEKRKKNTTIYIKAEITVIHEEKMQF